MTTNPNARNKSPRRNNNKNKNKSPRTSPTRHRGERRAKRAGAGAGARHAVVVFPPDPNETGKQTVDRIFDSFGLKDELSNECTLYMRKVLKKHHDAKSSASTIDKEDNLLNETHIPYITVDAEGARDLDQAMYITRKDLPGQQNQGQPPGFLISYALADGAYFMPASSPLFKRAIKMGGSSLYLPGRCIPMVVVQKTKAIL